MLQLHIQQRHRYAAPLPFKPRYSFLCPNLGSLTLTVIKTVITASMVDIMNVALNDNAYASITWSLYSRGNLPIAWTDLRTFWMTCCLLIPTQVRKTD